MKTEGFPIKLGRKIMYRCIGPSICIPQFNNAIKEMEHTYEYTYQFFDSDREYIKMRSVWNESITIICINKKLKVTMEDLLTLSLSDLLHKYLDNKLFHEYGDKLTSKDFIIKW